MKLKLNSDKILNILYVILIMACLFLLYETINKYIVYDGINDIYSLNMKLTDWGFIIFCLVSITAIIAILTYFYQKDKYNILENEYNVSNRNNNKIYHKLRNKYNELVGEYNELLETKNNLLQENKSLSFLDEKQETLKDVIDYMNLYSLEFKSPSFWLNTIAKAKNNDRQNRIEYNLTRRVSDLEFINNNLEIQNKEQLQSIQNLHKEVAILKDDSFFTQYNTLHNEFEILKEKYDALQNIKFYNRTFKTICDKFQMDPREFSRYLTTLKSIPKEVLELTN